MCIQTHIKSSAVTYMHLSKTHVRNHSYITCIIWILFSWPNFNWVQHWQTAYGPHLSDDGSELIEIHCPITLLICLRNHFLSYNTNHQESSQAGLMNSLTSSSSSVTSVLPILFATLRKSSFVITWQPSSKNACPKAQSFVLTVQCN